MSKLLTFLCKLLQVVCTSIQRLLPMELKFWTSHVRMTQQKVWFNLKYFHFCKTMQSNISCFLKKKSKTLSATPLNIYVCSMTSLIHFTIQNQVLLIWSTIFASIKSTSRMKLKCQCFCLTLSNMLKRILMSITLKSKMVKNLIFESKKLWCMHLIKLALQSTNRKNFDPSSKKYSKTTSFKNSILQITSCLKEQQSSYRSIINLTTQMNSYSRSQNNF